MNNKRNGTGIGLCSILTIVFLVLKLCGVISWSWLWVLSPIWITASLIIFFLTIGLLCNWLADRLEEKK